MSARISTAHLRVLGEIIQMSGLNAQSLIEQCGWKPADDSAEGAVEWVPVAFLDKLGRLAVEASGNPGFGLLAGGSPAMARYTIAAMLLMNAKTFEIGLSNVIKYSLIYQDRSELTLVLEGNLAKIKIDPLSASKEGHRFRSEFLMVGVLNMLRVAGIGQDGIRGMSFSYPAPDHVDEYAKHLCSFAHFSAPHNEVVFDQALLSSSIAGADPFLFASACTRAEMALAEVRAQTTILGRVKQEIVKQLAQASKMEDVANALGMTKRTLHRRLAEFGVNYNDILTESQIEAAKAMLAAEQMPIKEIASALGFTSASAFHRAFQRWTDQTPTRWRASISGSNRS